MLKLSYGIDHLFLSPYSPFLNPIEYSFNALKKSVRKEKLYNRDNLLQVIKNNIPAIITPTKAHKWFERSAKFYPQCAIGLPFTGTILKPIIATASDGVPDNSNTQTPTQLLLPSTSTSPIIEELNSQL